MRWLSSLLLRTPDWGDKIGHFLAYGALGFTAAGAQFVRLNFSWIILAALSTYGAILEGLQILGGSRSGEVLDGLANIAGSIAGFLGFFLLSFMVTRYLKKANL